MRVRGLGLTVFLAGVASLATEIAASRLVAPYFGSSNVVWANVIGIVLLFPCSRLLARRQGRRRASAPIAARRDTAGCCCRAPRGAVRGAPLLRAALDGFGALSVGIVVGSFFAVLALFAVPVLLMGAVAPFALRLALPSVAETGRVAGKLYALSTAGSILGTFLAALVAIPLIGTQRTLLSCAALLALCAVPLAPLGALAVVAVSAVLAALPPGGVKRTAGVLWEAQSPYQYVRVLQYRDGSRALELNEGIAQQSL